MAALVKDSIRPPQAWRMAVVEEVHPERADLVRVATIKTTMGSTRRPIHRIAVMEEVQYVVDVVVGYGLQ
jgi:hypothetical protein